MYEDGSIKPECYKEQVSEVQPEAIKEYQSQKRYMDQEEFLDKYEDAVNGLTDAYIENEYLDEDEARLKAMHTIADMKKIEITDLESA